MEHPGEEGVPLQARPAQRHPEQAALVPATRWLADAADQLDRCQGIMMGLPQGPERLARLQRAADHAARCEASALRLCGLAENQAALIWKDMGAELLVRCRAARAVIRRFGGRPHQPDPGADDMLVAAGVRVVEYHRRHANVDLLEQQQQPQAEEQRQAGERREKEEEPVDTDLEVSAIGE